jgi:hypothetical protein
LSGVETGGQGGSGFPWGKVLGWGAGVIAAAVVLFFIVRVVQPFQRQADPKPEDVATAWNDSIAKLGILPVYPPAEDLYVGDVWAVIAHSEDSPLLGKAVRVGHIDLRREILQSAAPAIFSDTAELAAGSKLRKQDPKEAAPGAPDNRIVLSLAAFPGITITHGVKSTGAAGASGSGWFGAQRDDSSVEQISIKSVETYGISPVDGVLKLDAWCSVAENKRYCADSSVRKILAFTVSDKVLGTKNGEYTSRIELRLVTRVFLMREIEHRRALNSAAGGVLQVLADPLKEPAVKDGAPKPEAPAEEAAAAVGRNLAASGSTGAKIALLHNDGTEMRLAEVFQRPLAFGFRAVTIALMPSKPSTGTVP